MSQEWGGPTFPIMLWPKLQFWVQLENLEMCLVYRIIVKEIKTETFRDVRQCVQQGVCVYRVHRELRGMDTPRLHSVGN